MPDEMDRVKRTKGGIEDMLSPIKESEGSYSPLQLHFLRRLHRLLRLRSEQGTELNNGGLRLIDRAIYSTYCDAVDVGVLEEAQKLLHRFSAPSKQRTRAE